MSTGIHSKIYNLRNDDFDYKDHLTLASIFNLTQDIAGLHADKLHIGYHDLLKKDALWVLIRNEVEILDNPPLYTDVKVTTWPIETYRVDMDRETLITSLDGKVYCKVRSKWALISKTTRSLTRIKNLYEYIDEFHKEEIFDHPLSKLEESLDSNYQEAIIKPTILDQDHNGHINNVKYFNYVYLAIKELWGKKISYCQMDYDKEIHLEDEVHIRYRISDDEVLVEGRSNNYKNFVAKIRYIK